MAEVLKPGWRWVRLGDVAVERTERVENPATSEFDRYVGSDDIDRYAWSVRRWRAATEVTSAAKIFHPGDYLFVRRSLYASDFRERAACADFSGVCSGDILPLREKSGAIEPGFLGAVLNHPRIWEYVVKHATGSITRRIKWRDLVEYEFALPPSEEQRRVTDILACSALVEDCLRKAAAAAKEAYESALMTSFARERYSQNINPDIWVRHGWPTKPLESVADPAAPISYGIVQPGDSVPDGVPTATSNNLNIGFADRIHLTSLAIEAGYARSRIEPHDVLVTVKGFGTGNIAIVPSFFRGNITRDVARIRFKNAEDGVFFVHLWKCAAYERYWRAVSVGTTRPELSIGKLRAMLVPWPAPEHRRTLASQLSRLAQTVAELEARRSRAADLHQTLIVQGLCNSTSPIAS